MRKLLLFSLLLCAVSLAAQNVGPLTITGSGCQSVSVDDKSTVSFYVSGATWTGTIQPKVALAGQAAVNVQVTPAASSTAQSTVTANGGYFTNIAGYSIFQLCGNTVTNTATVWVSVSRYVH